MRFPELFLAGALLVATGAQAADTVQTRFDAAVDRAKAAMVSDPRAAAAAARAAEPLALALADARARDRAQATALWLAAEALYRSDDLTAAAPLIERAHALVERSARDSALEADILLTRGSIQGKQLRVAEALGAFQRAHKLFRANGDPRREAITLICLANLYFEAKDYGSALRYLGEAMEAFPSDSGLAFAIHNTRGLVLQDQGEYARADAAFRTAMGHARAKGSASLEGVFLRNIARNQLLAGKVWEAEGSIAAARRASAGGEGDATQLDVLAAQAALQRGNFAEAGRLIDRAFAGVDPASTDSRFRYAHLTAVGAYGALHRDGKALAHLAALKRLDDEATKLATQTSSALMAANFDSARQDAKIADLRARDALQRAKAERTLFLTGGIALAIIMLLLTIALFTIRRSRDQVRAANDDLAVTNGALGKALAAKTEFLATTSHEIRTPLNGILGMTQVMLADRQLNGPTRDRLSIVHGAGLTMRALVDDILDVAKMETGNLGLDVADFDPAACVRDATAIWVDQVKAKGLAFEIDLARCPARVSGDAARVRQIVFNLLSNALKFTATGSIAIAVDLDVDNALRVIVRDTGIGIAPDKQAEVFESFRQADTSTTRRFGGTGLGLSICRSLADAMGGSIALDSVVGAGSTFTVTLPLPVLDAVPAPVAVAAGASVLVIDRNPITRAMFRTLLGPHAGAVAFAGTIGEVEAAMAAGGVTRLLIDHATVQAGGDGCMAAMLAAAGDAATTVLWPADDGAGPTSVLAMGATRVLVKPVTGAAVIAAMFSPGSDETVSAPLVSRAA